MPKRTFKEMKEKQIRVQIVADDLTDEKGFPSKYIGKFGNIIDWKRNPDRRNGRVPVIQLDDGKIICNKKIWWGEAQNA